MALASTLFAGCISIEYEKPGTKMTDNDYKLSSRKMFYHYKKIHVSLGRRQFSCFKITYNRYKLQENVLHFSSYLPTCRQEQYSIVYVNNKTDSFHNERD